METATQHIVERDFSVGTDPVLTVSNVAGKITIRVGDDERITVRATRTGSEAAIANTRIDTTQDGDRVRIETRADKSDRHFGFLSGNKMCAVDYQIEVPRTCRIAAKGVSASIEVHGTSGPLSLEAVSGSISVSNVSGACTISTVSGHVTGESIDAELQVHTTSGNTEVLRSRLRTFNLHGVSGKFTVETPLVTEARYFAKTVSGAIQLTVPSETAATLQLKTVSGRTSVDLPADVLKSGHRSWQGRINGGGATVEFSSISGSISIISGSGVDEPYMTGSDGSWIDVPPRTDTSDSKLEILRKLEAGEISVDDALSRLHAQR
ncbi:MAG: hypothetical protein NVSMB52_11330 [Chloroflexota bacterium]